jgi:NACHT domain
MRSRDGVSTDGQSLKDALREYGRELLARLKDFGVLSPLGRPVSRALHQPVTFRQDGRDSGHESQSSPRGLERSDTPPGAPLTAAFTDFVAFLRDRVAEPGAKPLLVLGTAGMGKSVLMETLAARLCEDLLNAVDDSAALPAVPILVALRTLPQNCRFPDDHAGFDEQLEGGLIESAFAYHPVLSRHHQTLFDARAPIFLFDGFDELSLRQRSALMSTLLSRSHRRFVLSSRPEHGAEQWFSADRQKSLAPLSLDACTAYVRRSFPSASPHEVTQQAALADFARSIEGPLGVVLTEPLFLRLWCDYLALAGAPPKHRRDLTTLLVHQLLDRRDVLGARQPEFCRPSDAWVRQAASWFEDYVGRLGVAFAANGFEPLGIGDARLPSATPDSNAWPTGPAVDGLAMAELAGLLVHRRPTATIQLLKVPLVEALTARHVARLSSMPAGACDLLALFRRWVWLPALHETLELVFEELRAGTAHQADLADQCCDWLLSVSDRFPAHRPGQATALSAACTMPDDVLCPFALLALRLSIGNSRERATQAVPRVLSRAARWGFFVGIPPWNHFVGIPLLERLPSELLCDAIKGVLVALQDSAFSDVRDYLVKAISDVARFIPSRRAGEMADVLIRSNDHSWPEKTRTELRAAAWTAANNMPRREVIPAVSSWLTEVRRSSSDHNDDALNMVIYMACRFGVPHDQACWMLDAWLTALMDGQTRTQSRWRRALIAAIQGASTCLPEHAITDVIRRWMRMLVDAEHHDPETREALSLALQGSSFCVPPGPLPALWAEWMGAFVSPERQGDALTRTTLVRVIVHGAYGLPANATEAAIDSLLAALAAAEPAEEGGLRRELASALAIVAARIPQDAALRVGEKVIAAYQREIAGPGDGNRSIGGELHKASFAAALRMPEHAAREAATRWLGSLQEEAEDQARSSTTAIESAIKGASSRIPESEAEAAVTSWLEEMGRRSGQEDRDCWFTLKCAIERTAARIPGDKAHEFVMRWIASLTTQCFQQDPGACAGLVAAIAGATRRVADSHADVVCLAILECLTTMPFDVYRCQDLGNACMYLLGRVSQGGAHRLRHALEGHVRCVQERRLRSSLKEMLCALETRLSPIEAWDLASAFCTQGRHTDALRVAAKQQELAIQLVFQEGQCDYSYMVRLRADEALMLDPELTCVPERLRTLMDGHGQHSSDTLVASPERVPHGEHEERADDRPELGSLQRDVTRVRSVVEETASLISAMHEASNASKASDVLDEADAARLASVRSLLFNYPDVVWGAHVEAALAETFTLSAPSDDGLSRRATAQRNYYRWLRCLAVATEQRCSAPESDEIARYLEADIGLRRELWQIVSGSSEEPPTVLDSIQNRYRVAVALLHPGRDARPATFVRSKDRPKPRE